MAQPVATVQRSAGDVLRSRFDTKVHGATFAVVSILLVTANLLLPVDRGFTALRLFGLPFRLSFVISIGSFLWLYLVSGGRLVNLVFRPYPLLQLSFVVVLLLGALRAPNMTYAIQATAAYAATFFVNHVVLTYIFENGYRPTFVKIVCTVGAIAAILGLAEGIWGFRLAPYDSWLSEYYDDYELQTRGFRILGTLGNPIFFVVAMSLLLPFIAELSRKSVEVAVTILAFAAGLITYSRTMLLVGLPLAWWYLVHRPRLVLVFVAVAAAFVFVPALLGTDQPLSQVYQRWTDRIETSEASTAYRIDAVRTGIMAGGNVIEILFGRGLGTQASVSVGIASWMSTLDNTYVSFFHEIGASGLLLYLCIYGYLLWRFRTLREGKAHYYAVAGLLLANLSFQSYNFYTFNFLAAASIASLFWYDSSERAQTPSGQAPVSMQQPLPSPEPPKHV